MLRADAANDVVTAYLLQSEAARSFVFSGDSRYLTEYRQGMVLAPSAEARLDQLPKTPEGTALFTQIQSAAATYSQAAQDIPTWRKWCAVRSTRR